MYSIISGANIYQLFETLDAALAHARKEATRNKQVVSIWHDSNVVIGVVTHDANGITLHRLVNLITFASISPNFG